MCLLKAHGLGQTRFGWLIGDPDFTATAQLTLMSAVGVPSSLSCVFGAVAIRDQFEPDKGAREALLMREQHLCHVLKSVGIRWRSPQAGIFGLADIRPYDSRQLSTALCSECGLLTAPGSLLGKPGHLRLSFGCYNPDFESTAQQLAEAIDRFAQANVPG
jgi:aspartate/methionine/tyrosine aminotransferase